MARSRLICIKHMSYALLALGVSVCALETGLRVYDSYTHQLSVESSDDAPLLRKSWLVHHGLKPLGLHVMTPPGTSTPVRIRTNSFGLRGAEFMVPKPVGVYRILCLGDEAVLAPELNEAETFCARLQEFVQSQTQFQVEVINAGVPGYCPLLSFLQMKHSLLALQPDVIVLNFDMSDVADDHRYRRHVRMGRDAAPLTCPHPRLILKKRGGDDGLAERFLILRWCKSRLKLIPSDTNRLEDRNDIDAPGGRFAWLRDHPPDWSVYIEQALSPIDHLHALSNRVYARLVLATYPVPWQVSAEASRGNRVRARAGVEPNSLYRSRKPFETLADFARERGILFCDASPMFDQVERPERLYLKNTPRFSRLGSELYAQVLASFLVQNVPGVWKNDSPGPRYDRPVRHGLSKSGEPMRE